jgi:hypothetical protein
MGISGGTSPHNTDWSNGESSQSISSLEAGWYTVTVTDNNGCVAIDSAEVLENDSLGAYISVVQDISCNGDSDGILQVNLTGGLGNFSYKWDDPGFSTSINAFNLPDGTYSVIVTDSVNSTNPLDFCYDTATYILIQPDELTVANIDSTNITCRGDANGRIAITMSGGTEPYSYDWSPYPLADTNVVENLGPATYPLTVTDSNGCTNSDVSITIQQPSVSLTVTEDATKHVDNNCFDDQMGELAVIASGGWENKYEYSRNLADWQNTAGFGGLAAGTYEIFVRDSLGCVESAQNLTITEAPEIVINNQSVIDNTIIVVASGGTAPLYYSLDGTGTPQTTGQFDDLDAGTYFVEVTDVNSCGPVRTDNLVVEGSSITGPVISQTSIYPNPSDGIISLNLITPDNGSFKISLFSLSGIQIFEEVYFAQPGEETTEQIDISDQPKGVYLIKVNNIVLNAKLVIE